MSSWLFLLMLVGVLSWAVHKLFGKLSPVKSKVLVEPKPRVDYGPRLAELRAKIKLKSEGVPVPVPAVAVPSPPVPAIATIQPIASFGVSLQSSIGADRVNTAYWQVMSELQGEGLTPDLMTALKPVFIDALGDPKRAGRLLADTFNDIDWDWPHWYSFAKPRDCNTVKDIRLAGAIQELHALLSGLLKDDLVALAASFDLAIKKSISKKEVIENLMLLPPEKLKDWVEDARLQWLEKQLDKVYLDMGRHIASRVSHLAINEHHYAQCSDPEAIRLHPYWRFICPEDWISTAPKKCRELDQKVLPAAEAMKIFPKIPCARLDCHCRFTTQR